MRYLTAGESHGKALVGIIEGIPAGIPLTAQYINHQLHRRQQGYGRGGRMSIEKDTVEILSGVRHGKTLGSPIALVIKNRDWENWKERMAVEENNFQTEKITVPRPGHADFAGVLKYDFDDIRNVIERASARETAMRVALCTVARRFLEECSISIGSHVLCIGTVEIKESLREKILMQIHHAVTISEQADRSQVRMIDANSERKALDLIKRAKKKGDTLGGIFEIIVTGVPIGLGSYVQWDRRLTGMIAQAVTSIQAIKGVEFGNGFDMARKYGSEVHDEFTVKHGKVTRKTNRAGGFEGGMTNGEMLIIKAAMKPISTLVHPLQSVDLLTHQEVKSRYERSDVCAVPAASVVGEAVVAVPLANTVLEKYGGDSLREIKERLEKALVIR
ncbi:MAG: chorismate synthase [Bacteroidetes bacterium]|nr:chorismate synthase [Bacteroidota bacterium]